MLAIPSGGRWIVTPGAKRAYEEWGAVPDRTVRFEEGAGHDGEQRLRFDSVTSDARAPEFPSGTYPRSLDYLKANASTFEEVRIGAAALDSLPKKPVWIDAWIKLADTQLNNDGTAGKVDGQARDTASVAAMKLRLGYPLANKS